MRVALHDGIAQLRRSAHRGVVREIVLDRRDGGIFDVLRRGEMRLARAEIHHVDALLAQLVGFGHHGHGGRGLNAVDSFGQFECGGCFGYWDSCFSCLCSFFCVLQA